MADEIRLRYTSGLTVYAIVRNASLQVYDAGDAAFEAQGTWNAARVDECDIVLTETAATAYGWYVGTFPAVAAGVYYVEYYSQGGAAPDPTDLLLQGEVWAWSGTARLLGHVDGISLSAEAADSLEVAAARIANKKEYDAGVETVYAADGVTPLKVFTRTEAAGVETLTPSNPA